MRRDVRDPEDARRLEAKLERVEQEHKHEAFWRAVEYIQAKRLAEIDDYPQVRPADPEHIPIFLRRQAD